ncbi:MAG: hypothetical protein E2P03_10725 [Acidobacteria bacterium]|nr:MAG: hypothetical protein E2P03_10725 [Acidobacteriota bacterium]
MTTLEMLPAAGSPALSLMAWLLTYAVHSTLLGAGVWMATTLLRGHALREILWKTALVGGLLTTTLQVGLGVEPLGGRLVLPAPAGSTQTTAPATDVEPLGHPPLSASSPAGPGADDSAVAAGAAKPSHAMSATEIALLADAPGTPFPSLSWGHLLLLAWLTGAVFALVRMFRGRSRFLAGLGRRLPVTNRGMLDAMARLRRKAGVPRRIRLTQSARLTSPVALGQDEICVPDRALVELSSDQQESMLAHELAHLSRRDPMWLTVSGVIESLFFFQPLNRLSRTHLQESSEFLCDEWAVRHTGRRRTLAHCLAHVASWLERTPHPAVLAPMARLGSPLLRRIQNLLQSNPAAAPVQTPRLRVMAAMLPLLAVAALAPAISGEERRAEDTPQAAPAPQAPSAAPAIAGAHAAPAYSSAPSAAAAPAFSAAPAPEAAPLPAAAVAFFAAPALAAAHEEREHRPSFSGTSSWVREDDGDRFSMKADGEIHFTEDMSNITSMAPGSSLRLDESLDGTSRSLQVTADENGLPAYTYRVNGDEVPFDPEGRDFLATGMAQIRRQRDDAHKRRAQAREERGRMAAEREAMRQQRNDMRRVQRDMSRELARAQQDMKREVARQHEQLRRQERDRAMAYRDAGRALQMDQRREDMERRRRMQDQQVDLRHQAREAFRRAQEMQRRAEQAEPDEREAAREQALTARQQAEEQVARVKIELALREQEVQREHEESSRHRQDDLERLQRDMEENRARDMEEIERLMQEYQRRLEDLQQEMMREMKEMEPAPVTPLAALAPTPYTVTPGSRPVLAPHPAPFAVVPPKPRPVLPPSVPPLPSAVVAPRPLRVPAPRLRPVPSAPLPPAAPEADEEAVPDAEDAPEDRPAPEPDPARQ